jgi:hypothetical protein
VRKLFCSGGKTERTVWCTRARNIKIIESRVCEVWTDKLSHYTSSARSGLFIANIQRKSSRRRRALIDLRAERISQFAVLRNRSTLTIRAHKGVQAFNAG